MKSIAGGVFTNRKQQKQIFPSYFVYEGNRFSSESYTIRTVDYLRGSLAALPRKETFCILGLRGRHPPAEKGSKY
jgi:hypothetical protein